MGGRKKERTKEWGYILEDLTYWRIDTYYTTAGWIDRILTYLVITYTYLLTFLTN